MRHLLTIALCALLCGVMAADKFIFSADGVTVGSSPRELPAQGFDRQTGRVVVGLHARTDAERAACGWWRIVQTPKPGIVFSNEYWKVSGYVFTNYLAHVTWGKAWRKVAVRTWTPLSIKRACGDKWPTVKSALQGAEIYEDFIMAQELREDDPAFQRGYAWACDTYGTNVVNAILEAAR